MNARTVLNEIKKYGDERNVEGMQKFGITGKKIYGVSIPILRGMAKTIGKKHKLAQELWDTEVHEARILASMIDDFNDVTEKQMDSWVKDFDSWDVCDQVCMNLFDKTRFAPKKAKEWTRSDKEFVKRAGFALIATMAVHIRELDNEFFIKLMPLIKKGATDDRNFVKKSVNWALRQIGKRNEALNAVAIKTAEEISKMDSSTAKWIASDALRELKSSYVDYKLSRADK